MLDIKTTNKFKKDLKAVQKQGNKKGIKELESVVSQLQNGEQLAAKYNDHNLHKNSDIPEGSRGCHLLNDLILVYSIKDNILLLQQLGNHHTLKGFKESLETVEEDIEKHDTLNPKLFDENNKLKPEVHDKILEIVDEFVKGLEEDGIKIKVKDVKIVGSNCSYNYNKDSDLDVHIVADTKDLECPDDLYPLLYSAYRSIWNNKIDIDFYGIPVELYVETIEDEIDTDAEPMGEELEEKKVFNPLTGEFEVPTPVDNTPKERHIEVDNTFVGGFIDVLKNYYDIKKYVHPNGFVAEHILNDNGKYYHLVDYGFTDSNKKDKVFADCEYIGKDISKYKLIESLQEAKQENAVKSNGVYSVLKDKWIKEPVQADIPDIDMNAFEELFREWEDKYFDTVESNSVESIENFIEDIYDLRKSSIANEGEYGLGNLVFKECRAMGYLDNLKDLKNELKSKELSLEGLDSDTELEESMVGRNSITNNKIVGYINDCIDAVKKLNFKTSKGDVIDFTDIDCKEGSTSNTLGVMSLPKTQDGNFTLTLNSYMYDEPEESIKNTILHELCHYVQLKQAIGSGGLHNSGGHWYLKYGYERYKGHGSVWKNIASVVGRATNQDITRVSKLDMHSDVAQQRDSRTRYVIRCSNCGKEYQYQKKSKAVQDIASGNNKDYYCGVCKKEGTLELVDNEK